MASNNHMKYVLVRIHKLRGRAKTNFIEHR
jgi:hypothetical protein